MLEMNIELAAFEVVQYVSQVFGEDSEESVPVPICRLQAAKKFLWRETGAKCLFAVGLDQFGQAELRTQLLRSAFEHNKNF